MENKKYDVGFIQGVFDLFHIGHLNLIRRAREQCNTLIVGVNTDELVKQYKGKTPIVNYEERAEIVSEIKGVDKVVKMEDRNKILVSQKYNINVIFMGDDWKGTDFYKKAEKDLKQIGVDIVYFPYTKSVSSTALAKKMEDFKSNSNEKGKSETTSDNTEIKKVNNPKEGKK